jgi:hypothetical protein
MKKVLVVGVMLMAIIAMALPGHAAGVVLTTNATATLPTFPGDDFVSSLGGSATGLGTGQPSGNIRLLTGDSIHYTETTCAEGTATGTFHIGADQLGLNWNRVGAVAVLRLTGSGQTGVAVAVFRVPPADANKCLPGNAGQVTADIVAAGVAVP